MLRLRASAIRASNDTHFRRRNGNAGAVERQHADLPAEHSLDRSQAIALVIRDERKRLARATGTTRAADAVHVVLGHVGQLVIDDLRQFR